MIWLSMVATWLTVASSTAEPKESVAVPAARTRSFLTFEGGRYVKRPSGLGITSVRPTTMASDVKMFSAAVAVLLSEFVKLCLPAAVIVVDCMDVFAILSA
jgi:hypothetical protein